MLSKKATCNSHGQDSSYFLGWQEYEKNPYHKDHNPTGIIQMGLAENQLSFDILESWVAANPDAAMMRNRDQSMLRELALFQDYHGLPALKNELAEYMAQTRQNKVTFDPDKLVLTAGSTCANEIIMFCIAEPGEAFLIPTPYYPGFDRDLKWRTGVEIVPINCSSKNNFRVTMPALEDAYEVACKKNLRVKGILITNPSNPLGTTTNQEEFNHLIRFAMARNIHIVSDEIYAGTVYDCSSNFTTIIQALKDRRLEHTSFWNRAHIVSGLSKDLGLPGFRVGMIYSNNGTLTAAATKMSSFGLVSSQTQFLVSKLLGDRHFTRTYIKETHRRLQERQNMFVTGLEKLGILSLKSNAGLFCWVDMRHLLKSNTFEAEIELWKEILYKCGINISAGSSCHCYEPGWFRICYANVSEETLKVSIQRIKGYLDSIGDRKCKNHQQFKLEIKKRICWSNG